MNIFIMLKKDVYIPIFEFLNEEVKSIFFKCLFSKEQTVKQTETDSHRWRRGDR